MSPWSTAGISLIEAFGDVGTPYGEIETVFYLDDFGPMFGNDQDADILYSTTIGQMIIGVPADAGDNEPILNIVPHTAGVTYSADPATVLDAIHPTVIIWDSGVTDLIAFYNDDTLSHILSEVAGGVEVDIGLWLGDATGDQAKLRFYGYDETAAAAGYYTIGTHDDGNNLLSLQIGLLTTTHATRNLVICALGDTPALNVEPLNTIVHPKMSIWGESAGVGDFLVIYNDDTDSWIRTGAGGIFFDAIAAGDGVDIRFYPESTPVIDIGADVFETGIFVKIGYDSVESSTGALTVIQFTNDAALTLGADIIGIDLDFSSNLTVADNYDITGYILTMPALAQTTAVTTNYRGFYLDTAGAISDSSTTALNWYGTDIIMPQATVTGTATMTVVGHRIATAGALAQNTAAGRINWYAHDIITPVAVTDTALVSRIDVVGFRLATAGEITSTAAGNILNWTGTEIQIPNVTQTAGALTAIGIDIDAGTVTTGGTVHGINIAMAAAYTTANEIGIFITGDARQVEICNTDEGILISPDTAGAGVDIAIDPLAAGANVLDIGADVFETGAFITVGYDTAEESSGTVSVIHFTNAAALTLGGDLMGINIDFNANITAVTDHNVTVYQALLPALTQSVANSTYYKGFHIATAGALVQDSAAGMIEWSAVEVATPQINISDAFAGSISVYGFYIDTVGSLTTGAAGNVGTFIGNYIITPAITETAGTATVVGHYIETGVYTSGTVWFELYTDNAGEIMYELISRSATITHPTMRIYDSGGTDCIAFYDDDSFSWIVANPNPLNVQVSGDTDDYIQFNTVSSVPGFTTIGDVDLDIQNQVAARPYDATFFANQTVPATTPLGGSTPEIRIYGWSSATINTQVYSAIWTGAVPEGHAETNNEIGVMYINPANNYLILANQGAAANMPEITAAATHATLRIYDSGWTDYIAFYNDDTLSHILSEVAGGVEVDIGLWLGDATGDQAKLRFYGYDETAAAAGYYTIGTHDDGNNLLSLQIGLLTTTHATRNLVICARGDTPALNVEPLNTIVHPKMSIWGESAAAGDFLVMYNDDSNSYIRTGAGGIFFDAVTDGTGVDIRFYPESTPVIDIGADVFPVGTFITVGYDIIESSTGTVSVFHFTNAAALTLGGDLMGMNIDFNANITAVTDHDVTVYQALLPALTQSVANTTNYKGFHIATAGALAQDSAAGTINWSAIEVATPQIAISDAFAGIITVYGFFMDSVGSLTTGAAGNMATFIGTYIITPAITETAGTAMAIGHFIETGIYTSGTVWFEMFTDNAGDTMFEFISRSATITHPTMRIYDSGGTDCIQFYNDDTLSHILSEVVGGVEVDIGLWLGDATGDQAKLRFYGYDETAAAAGYYTIGTHDDGNDLLSLQIGLLTTTHATRNLVICARGDTPALNVEPLNTIVHPKMSIWSETAGVGDFLVIYNDDTDSWIRTGAGGIFFDAIAAGDGVDIRFYPESTPVIDIGADIFPVGTFITVGYDTVEESTGTVTVFHFTNAAALTLGGDLMGMNIDFNANITAVTDHDVTVYQALLPALTQSVANTTNYKGFHIATAGALAQDSAAGTINWSAIEVATPQITISDVFAGIITVYGFYIDSVGSMTSGAAGNMATFIGTSIKTPAITETAGTAMAIGHFIETGVYTSGTVWFELFSDSAGDTMFELISRSATITHPTMRIYDSGGTDYLEFYNDDSNSFISSAVNDLVIQGNAASTVYDVEFFSKQTDPGTAAMAAGEVPEIRIYGWDHVASAVKYTVLRTSAVAETVDPTDDEYSFFMIGVDPAGSRMVIICDRDETTIEWPTASAHPALYIYDAGATDYLRLFDDGSISTIESNANPIYLLPDTGVVRFRDADDTDNTLYLEISTPIDGTYVQLLESGNSLMTQMLVLGFVDSRPTISGTHGAEVHGFTGVAAGAAGKGRLDSGAGTISYCTVTGATDETNHLTIGFDVPDLAIDTGTAADFTIEIEFDPNADGDKFDVALLDSVYGFMGTQIITASGAAKQWSTVFNVGALTDTGTFAKGDSLILYITRCTDGARTGAVNIDFYRVRMKTTVGIEIDTA